MKKSLVLGAAALAAVMMAAPQQSNAGEVKVGGYYMFRVQDSDATLARDAAGVDNSRYWAQRLQLKNDFIHDDKTHAHMVVRVLDSNTVQGADSPSLNCDTNALCSANVGRPVTGVTTVGTPAATVSRGADWDVRTAWLETEAWGVGLKVGNMPLSLNDNILVGTDETGFGAITLSKTFGDITAVLANVRVREGNTNGKSATVAGATTVGNGADDDDENLYALSLFGKVDQINYDLTAAYFRAERDSIIGNPNRAAVVASGANNYPPVAAVSAVNPKQAGKNSAVHDSWLAATVHTDLTGIADLTGTLIYESGMSDYATPGRVGDSGYLGALRAKGGSQIGEWNAYGFWSSKNFTNVTNDNMKWSQTWDMGGPGAVDLMSLWATGTTGSPSENMAGIGVGLKIKVDEWTINPMLDYASVVKKDYDGNGADSASDKAWGGALQVSTPINKATTLYLTGVFVDPKENDAFKDTVSNMHTIETSLQMKF